MYGRGRSEDMFNLCLNFNESQPSYANTRYGYKKECNPKYNNFESLFEVARR